MAIPERIKDLIDQGNRLFSRRGTLNSYMQEVCEHFYPERALFTASSEGYEWWGGLNTSHPVLKRRELGNLMAPMLRPDGKEWFGLHLLDEDADKNVVIRRWLEWMTRTQRAAMYYQPAHFVEAAKMTDHDWVTLGMGIMEIDVRRDMASLLYRNHHISEFAWIDNEYGETDTVYRRWSPTIRDLARYFKPEQLSSAVRTKITSDPDKRISCFRVILPRARWDADDPRRGSPQAPFKSVWVDIENQHVIAEVPQLWMRYVIPRWQKIHGSQYGFSPATGPGLADARTLQVLMEILLEASEKAADPPLVADEESLRSDLNVFSGGVTFYDAEYAEKRGDPLRPLDTVGRGLPYGFELLDRHVLVLEEGFFLDKLQLPQFSGEQPTAYHVRKMLEEHIRSATPLLAPAEDEYSARICERTFDVLRVVKAFGPEENIPDALRGRAMQFKFTSPLRELSDEMKAQTLLELVDMTLATMQVEPEVRFRVNWIEAFDEAAQGNQTPANWIASDEEFAARLQQFREQQAQQQAMAALEQGATAAGRAAPAVAMLEDQRAA